LELRLGGIYALERIARDSERDHWPIMEVLTAYVREHAPTHLPANQTNPVAQDPAPLATDIQAIVTVIRRREWNYEKNDQRLDLHRTDLHGADLRDTHLTRANLTGANLTGTNLGDANLTRADLLDSYLMGADLKDAQGVTQAEIDSAIGNATTKLPAGIVMPKSWKKKAS
jgi:Pentapeptide repeats (8 copies)